MTAKETLPKPSRQPYFALIGRRMRGLSTKASRHKMDPLDQTRKGATMANQYAPPQANVDDVTPGGGSITARMVDAMRGTKPWGLLIGILLFVGAAFSVIGGVGVL